MHSKTRFTKEPETTVYARLGSDAKFEWEFTFGVDDDWNKFDQIVWGKTDNNYRISTKYITILKNKKGQYNPNLAASIKSRANWTGNITQHGCQVVFTLRNVTRSDLTITYGCIAEVSGYPKPSGPIKLSLYGKCARYIQRILHGGDMNFMLEWQKQS